MEQGQASRNKFDWHFPAVATLFLLSGLSSLIYQVIWTRMLVFVFGSTTFATSTVLAVFMGGLALGSFAAGRMADRTAKPLLWYGALEGLVGVWALITPFLFSLAIPLYKAFFEPLHNDPIVFGLLRFAVAAAILFLPTACMGATLPLLARFVTERLDQVGDRVGSLYAINTFGAVLGSLLAGFTLLPALGLSLTTLIAAIINILLALSVFLFARIPGFGSGNLNAAPASDAIVSGAELEANSPENSKKSPETEQASEPNLSALVSGTMAAFAVSGALAMVYEVAWTRTLLMVVGSTTYAFTVMLSSFLIGIFLGSLICARFADKLKSPILWFSFAQIMLALAGLMSLLLFNNLPYLNLYAGVVCHKDATLTLIFRFLASGMVLLPISLCLGVIFPLAVKVCARDLQRIGSSVGQLYSMNTLGAIIGAFLAGFLVIPNLGSEQTLVWCAVINFALGVFLLVAFGNAKTSIKAICAATSVLLIYWASQAPVFWNINSLVATQLIRRIILFRPNLDLSEVGALQQRYESQGKIAFYKEGKAANVAVRKNDDGGTSLLTNGHVDASDGPDMENQAMLAALPLMLNSRARDVCVIGWGSGVTAGFALRFPIEQLVCSEIEPTVIETSPFFHKVNFSPETDKRLVVEPSDGRNYLLGTSRKFDVIISEPSNPWQAGVCNLFTSEYFKICRDSLKPGGVFTMWSQTNEIPTKNLGGVFKSLNQVFPCVFIMFSGLGDVNALAFAQPVKISYAELKKSLEHAPVRDSLAQFKMKTPEDFIARIVVCPDGIASGINDKVPNTDDSNHLEYDVAKTYENRVFVNENRDWLVTMSSKSRTWDFIDWGSMNDEEKSREFIKVAKACLSRAAEAALPWAEEAWRLDKKNADALAFLAELDTAMGRSKDAAEKLALGKQLFPGNEKFVGLEGVIALKRGDYLKARELLSASLNLNPENNDFRYFLATTYSDLDMGEVSNFFRPPPSLDPAKVIELCRKPAQHERFCAAKPEVLLLLADAYNKSGKLEEAESILKTFTTKSPKGYLAWQLLAENYALQKSFERSRYCWNRSFMASTQAMVKFMDEARDLLNKREDAKALRKLQRVMQMTPANPPAWQMLESLAKTNREAGEYLDSLKTAIPLRQAE